MHRSGWLCLLIIGLTVSLRAQTPPDRLTPSDTIGRLSQRTFLTPDSYTYHAATRLSAHQIIPLLLRSPDTTVMRLTRRARRRYWLPAPLMLGSFGVMTGGLRAARLGHYEQAGVLSLVSAGLLIDGFVVSLSAPGTLHRAVRRYNQTVRYTGDAYADPLRNRQSTAFMLTPADSIGRSQAWLGDCYTYRTLGVLPDSQLAQAMQSLNDTYLNEGLRQNRVVRGVGGLVGGVSAAYLTSYYLSRLLVLGAGYSVRERTNPLVYAALGGVAASFVLRGVANRTTWRLVVRYNERLGQPD